jgi:hypothetical protein
MSAISVVGMDRPLLLFFTSMLQYQLDGISKNWSNVIIQSLLQLIQPAPIVCECGHRDGRTPMDIWYSSHRFGHGDMMTFSR